MDWNDGGEYAMVNTNLVDEEEGEEVEDYECEERDEDECEGGNTNTNANSRPRNEESKNKNTKKDKISKKIRDSQVEVDRIDLLMKETKVTGETLNQLHDWMDDMYGHQPTGDTTSHPDVTSEQIDALRKLDEMDSNYKIQMDQIEHEYKIDDVDLDVDTDKFNFEYSLYE